MEKLREQIKIIFESSVAKLTVGTFIRSSDVSVGFSFDD